MDKYFPYGAGYDDKEIKMNISCNGSISYSLSKMIYGICYGRNLYRDDSNL